MHHHRGRNLQAWGRVRRSGVHHRHRQQPRARLRGDPERLCRRRCVRLLMAPRRHPGVRWAHHVRPRYRGSGQPHHLVQRLHGVRCLVNQGPGRGHRRRARLPARPALHQLGPLLHRVHLRVRGAVVVRVPHVRRRVHQAVQPQHVVPGSAGLPRPSGRHSCHPVPWRAGSDGAGARQQLQRRRVLPIGHRLVHRQLRHHRERHAAHAAPVRGQALRQ